VSNKKTPPEVGLKEASGESEDATKKRPKYIKLKRPSDIMAYVQTLINRLREEDKEISELSKITNLLNTWIMAHKDHMETEEFKKLRAEMDAWRDAQEKQ
jgi:hypothetical protein